MIYRRRFYLSFLLGILIVFAILITLLYSKYKVGYRQEVEEISTKYDIEQSLIFAIIKCESDFDKDAVSPKGAVGLMQIMPNTAKFIHSSDDDINLYDAGINIEVGSKYIRYLMDKYNKNAVLVLTAYNAGEGIVDSWLKQKSLKNNENQDLFMISDIKYKETRVYVEKVLKSKFYYEKLYNL